MNQHFRKAKPSSQQLMLAKIEKVVVPKGMTFVRGHYRGDNSSQRIYKSRSALNLLLEEPRSETFVTGNYPEWFEFERHTAQVLKAFGYQITKNNLNSAGDGGVDIIAQKADSSNESLVYCQCKCWKRNVGVETVREFLGVLIDAEVGLGFRPKGIIATTSDFSAEAVKLAFTHNIELINGDRFTTLANASSI